MELMDFEVVREYIESLLKEVKNKEVHEEITLEILSHIEERYEDALERGLNSEEGILESIKAMGSPEEAGQRLNIVHKGKIEWGIVIPSILMCCIGVFLMFFMVGYDENFSRNMALRTVIYSVMGVIFAVLLYKFDYRKMERHCLKIFIGANLLLLFSVFWGNKIHGVKRFFTIGNSSIDIIQVFLFLICLSLPGVLKEVKDKGTRTLIYLIGIYGVPSSLLFLMPSVMSFIIYTGVYLILVKNSKLQKKEAFLLPGGVLGYISMKIITTPYMKARIAPFINMSKDPNGMGYINNQINNLIGLSKLFGNGIDKSLQLLPELHTDYVFVYVVYTFGWIFALALVGMVIFFIHRIFSTSRVVKDNYGKLILMSFATVFSIEFSWSILMNLNLVPIMSINCPFISYGGTAMVLNIASIGLMMSVYKRKNYSSKATIIN
ncbi:FtsW/RodA/SpoVE family cell cycle protein [Clostridium malenominatum]|uniref:FtsW/RodA/SpoVE family cell cycle protein n=1 Tax=Clostridium malenominatum TaxID=1539 RepID=A0ABN1IYI4_9CLOT